jgi:hypothetical protein
MKNKKKAFTLLTIVIVILAAALLIGRYYVLGKIKTKIEDQLHALRDSGYIVKYDSITVDPQKNTVSVYKLTIRRDLDTTLCTSTDFFSAYFIKAEGFKILPLLLKRRLSFKSIHIDSPKIVLYKNFFAEREEPAKKDRKEFSISVENIKLPHVNFTYHDSSSCVPSIIFKSNAGVRDFILSFYKDRPAYYNITAVSTDSMDVSLPKSFYTFTVRQATLNLDLGIFDLDTLKIIPHLGKIAFGRKKGKQTDRFEGVLPYINLAGLSILKEDTVAFVAQKMTAQLYLKVFRDKRLPFKNPVKRLPIETLNTLGIGIKIDSFRLNKSYIEYEEFAEDADSAGFVFFDDVYASLKGINNTEHDKKGFTEMIAAASFMGQGELKVNAMFPWRTNAKSKVKGTLKDMDFSKLNTILEPQAKVRAESGHLDNLSFNFFYNDDKSSGNLEMNYKDLKLVTFKSDEQIEKVVQRKNKRKKGDEEPDTDKPVQKAQLKTFVLNAFILKRNTDSNAEETRNGTINFVRDKHRSVFNYWAKSMFSGIKSAYKLDKLEDSGIKKLLAKKHNN